DLRDAHLVNRGAAPESLLRDGDDCVLHRHVSVDVDRVHLDDRGAVHNDVVDDARAAPPGPVRLADEPWAPPPRDERLAPAESDTAHRRRAHASARSAKERDERRSVDRSRDEGTGRPRPEAIDEDPTTVVI